MLKIAPEHNTTLSIIIPALVQLLCAWRRQSQSQMCMMELVFQNDQVLQVSLIMSNVVTKPGVQDAVSGFKDKKASLSVHTIVV